MDNEALKQEVWETIQRMNRLWTEENKPDELEQYFHQDMVAVTPVDRKRREGRAACISGWKSFTEAAKILYWHEIEPLVTLFGEGQFAVVSYYFDMAYEMGGATIQSSGRDLFALVKEEGRWWIVSDQFSSYP